MGDQVGIGFTFASDWLRGWCKFSTPITERSKANPMQSRITFDTQLKIALLGILSCFVDVGKSDDDHLVDQMPSAVFACACFIF